MAAAAQIQSPTSAPLSYGAKIFYGVGEIANAIKLVTFALYSLFFATVVQGLPGTWVGIVALASMLWDAFVDPYVGYLTDGENAVSKRLRSMTAGALTMGLGLWAFFSPPHHLSMVMLFVWLLGASFILRTATSMFNIPYYAIGAALAHNYQERTSITGIRNMATAIGTLLTASLSSVIFFPDKTPGVDPKMNSGAYSTMGLTFGLLMTVTAAIALLGTLRVRGRLESAVPDERSRAPRRHFLRGMWDSLQVPSFRVMLSAFSIEVIALAVNGSLLIHYLKYYAGVGGSVALGISQAAFYGAGFVGTIFWLRVARYFDKHRLYIFSAGSTAVLMIAGLLLFGDGHIFGTGSVTPLMLGFGLAGFFGCMLWFLPPSMLADVADEMELETGERPEGALFGTLSFAKQIATGVAILVAGGLLDRFVKLTPGESSQAAVTVYRIGVVYSVLPAALFLIAGALMLRYPLTRARVESIQAALHARRSAKAVLQQIDDKKEVTNAG